MYTHNGSLLSDSLRTRLNRRGQHSPHDFILACLGPSKPVARCTCWAGWPMLRLATLRGSAGALSRSCRGFRAATATAAAGTSPRQPCRHAACDGHALSSRARWTLVCRSYSGSLPLGEAGQNFPGSGSGDSSSSSSSSGGNAGWHDQQAAGGRGGASWPSDDSSSAASTSGGGSEVAGHLSRDQQDQASTSGLFRQDFSRCVPAKELPCLSLQIQNPAALHSTHLVNICCMPDTRAGLCSWRCR